MTEITQVSGFNRHALGIGSLQHEADLIGEAYWGNISSGTPVDIMKASKRAQERFATTSTELVPLVPNVPEDLIYKAIFEYGNYEGADADSYNDEVGDLRKSFLDNHTVAVDMMKSETDAILKATTTAEGMIHTIYDEKVAYLYKRPYPFQALIPVVANKGKVAAWDAMPPYDFGSAYFGTEDASLTESDIVSKQMTDTIKYMYSVGRVTRAAQLAGLSAVPARDLMMIRVDAAQDALRSLRERSMLGVTRNIRSKAFAFETAGALEYDGIYKLITDNVDTYDNQCWKDGTGLSTYPEIEKKLDESYEEMVVMGVQPTMAVCDYKTFGIYRRALKEYFRTEPVQTFVQGISKISLVFPGEGALPLVPHPFMPMTAGSRAIMLINNAAFERRQLWGDMYEDLAKINLSQKFVVSAAECLIDKTQTDSSFTSSLNGGVFNMG
jgi:hypothetical protein